jgi:hypothetical protein
MNVKALSFACLLVCVLVPDFPAQKRSADKSLNRPGQNNLVDPASTNLRRVHELVDRAKSFDDLQSRTTTLVNLADLLWSHPKEEKYARQIMVGLRDDLKGALVSESKISSSSRLRTIVRLQQLIARFVSKHDPKLGAAWFEEDLGDDSKANGSKRLDFALDLVSDGSNPEAERFAKSAIDDGFSGLDLRILLSFLHRLRSQNGPSADSLFLQVLGKVAASPRTSADDLLLIGNYLFIHDRDAGPGSVRYTGVTIDAMYFPVGISAERSGVTRQLAKPYLETAMVVLNHQLNDESTKFPRRYEAVARMLLEKAQKFAPELIAPFTALARKFSVSSISPFPALNDQAIEKLINYESAVTELEKLQGAKRDDRCIPLIATAYLQNDLDTATKLSQLIVDDGNRSRVRQLLAWRRGSNYLLDGDKEGAEKLASEIENRELVALLQLGIANLETSRHEETAALVRLQSLVEKVRNSEIPGRGLYLLSAASLIARINANAALEVVDHAAKEFDSSSSSIGELGKREHLTTIQLGSERAFFSINSKSIPFGNFEESIGVLIRHAKEQTLSVLLRMHNEKILGPALIAAAREMLSKKSVAA